MNKWYNEDYEFTIKVVDVAQTARPRGTAATVTK